MIGVVCSGQLSEMLWVPGVKYRLWSRKNFLHNKKTYSTVDFVLFAAFFTNTLVTKIAHSSGL